MGLYNPILGDIPRPQTDRENVFNELIPNPNYKGTVISPRLNKLYCLVIENTNDDNNIEYTTTENVLTRILFQGYFVRPNSDVTGTADIYINGVKIISLNYALEYDAADPEANKEVMFNYDIPLEHITIPINSSLRVETARTNGTLITNCSFIGYEYPKQ